MKINNLLCGVLGVALLGACAGPQYRVSMSPTVTLPEPGRQALGDRTLMPDEVVFTAPVGYARAAQLAEDSLVEIIGRQFAFARDETLPIALIAGRAKDNVPDGSLAFCGRPNADLAKNMLAASTLGITSVFNRTSGTPRVCFFDEEKDDMADMAVLVGVKSDADAVPVKIEPLRYTIVELQPMSGESQIRITYRGKTGLVGGHVSFDLAVMEQGTALYFDNWRRKIDIADLPQDVSMFGANFTVHSYDRESGKVQVTIRRGIQSGPYGITSVPTTRTIPIFIPG